MKYKVKAKYFVEAGSWNEAEQQVENGLVEADQIESEPASRHARDIVTFGVSDKIAQSHSKIFFEPVTDKPYDVKVDELRQETIIWMLGILDDIISTNESNWG